MEGHAVTGPEEHLSDGAVVEVSSGAVNSAGPPSAVPSPGAAALPDTALPPPCKNEGTAGEQATAGSTLPSAHAKVQLLGRGSASDVKPDREGCAPPPLFMQRDDWLPTPTQRQQDGKLQWQRAPSIEESPLGQTLEDCEQAAECVMAEQAADCAMADEAAEEQHESLAAEAEEAAVQALAQIAGQGSKDDGHGAEGTGGSPELEMAEAEIGEQEAADDDDDEGGEPPAAAAAAAAADEGEELVAVAAGEDEAGGPAAADDMVKPAGEQPCGAGTSSCDSGSASGAAGCSHSHSQQGTLNLMQPAANPALSSLPSTTEQPPASLSARKDAANTKLQQLRRFAAHCASLFGQEVLPGEEDLHSASFDTVAAALTLQLGASVLKDLADGRNEWQMLGDLLSQATGRDISADKAERFLQLPLPGLPGGPDFERMHAAGLYPAAWPLPLEREAVDRAQQEQHAAQHPPEGLGVAQIGQRVKVFWAGDNSWYCAKIDAFCRSSGKHTIVYEVDGQEMDADLAREPVIFLMNPEGKNKRQAPLPRQRQAQGTVMAPRGSLERLSGGARTSGGRPSSRQGPAQRGVQQLLQLSKRHGAGPAERLRCLVGCLRQLIPTAKEAVGGPGSRSMRELQQDVCHLLGQAPAYAAALQDPFDYVQQLLAWGAPAGASLDGCVVSAAGEQPVVLDLAVLHAAGCFPHRWEVPLQKAAVQAANRQAAAGGAEAGGRCSAAAAATAAAAPPPPPSQREPPRQRASLGRAGSSAAATATSKVSSRVFSLRDGWWLRPLSVTACDACNSVMSFHADMFEMLAGRPPMAPLDVLEARDVDLDRIVTFRYKQSSNRQLVMREWVADTGAQPCDSIAFKREGSELLVRRVPATQQPKGRPSGSRKQAGQAAWGEASKPPKVEQDEEPVEEAEEEEAMPLPFAPQRSSVLDLQPASSGRKRKQQAQHQQSAEPPAALPGAGEAAAAEPKETETGPAKRHRLAAQPLSSPADDAQRPRPSTSGGEEERRHLMDLYRSSMRQVATAQQVAAEQLARSGNEADPHTQMHLYTQAQLMQQVAEAVAAAAVAAVAPHSTPPAASAAAAATATALEQAGIGPATANLAEKAEATMQRVLQQAEAHLEKTSSFGPSTLLALQCLASVGHGGPTLQEVVLCWAAYPAAVQQKLHDGVVVSVRNQSWQGLEGKLHRVLRNSGVSCSAAATGSRPPAPGTSCGSNLLQMRAAEATVRGVQEAVGHFLAADRTSSGSMLRPLDALSLVELCGHRLEEVVEGWGGFELGQQQTIFDAMLVATHQGAWKEMEGRLRVVLDIIHAGSH